MKDITDVIVARFRKRRDHGAVKYGKTLLPWDGRNTAEDCLEEALDLAVYLQKLVIERAECADLLRTAAALNDRGPEISDEYLAMAERLSADIPRIGVPK